MAIRYLIIDDEPLARTRIVKLMEACSDFHLIRECRNGKEAVKAIEKYRPEVIFLDVRMPGMDGFDALAASPAQDKPYVIFITGFEQYATKAFDVNAVDYLVKPFEDHRFYEAVARAREQLELQKSHILQHKIKYLFDAAQNENNDYLSHFRIKENGFENAIDVNDVYWIEEDDNYFHIQQAERSDIYRSTMKAIESKLDPEMFLRIHRSIIINTLHVKQISYAGKNEYKITLRNGKILHSSRSYKAQIAALLQKNSMLAPEMR